MSYNVAVVIPPIPSNDKEAWQRIDALIDAEGEPPKVFRELHDRLTAKYPCICTLADNEVDNRTLRKGDHYLLVLWDSSPPSEHPIRDFLKPVGAGVLIAFGIGIAIVASVEYNISWERVRKYVPAPTPRRAVFVFVGVFLLALLGFRLLNWLLVASSEREGRQEKESE